jgi:hypothetical protein
MSEPEPEEIPLVSTEEAIAEVRRWLEAERVDPERVFSVTGDQTIRYKDLIAHLEQETPDGRLLRFAISRGRLIAHDRAEVRQRILQIASAPAAGSAPQPARPEGSAPPDALPES